MTGKYRNISDYEKENIKMYEQGMSLRKIGERLGFTLKEMRDFKTRYNIKQRMIEAGRSLRREGSEAVNQISGNIQAQR